MVIEICFELCNYWTPNYKTANKMDKNNYIQLRFYLQEYFIECAILYLYGSPKTYRLSLSVIFM